MLGVYLKKKQYLKEMSFQNFINWIKITMKFNNYKEILFHLRKNLNIKLMFFYLIKLKES